MLESLVSGFADISLPELALIAGMALVASVVGGVAGYGTGALMPRRGLALSTRGLAVASFGWGPLAGGTVGAGIILLSLLMAAGLEGAAVVATDAVVSIGIGLTKFATFGLAGAIDAKVIAIALLIGCVAFPGAFVAKALTARLPLHVHTAILDAMVLGGG